MQGLDFDILDIVLRTCRSNLCVVEPEGFDLVQMVSLQGADMSTMVHQTSLLGASGASKEGSGSC